MTGLLPNDPSHQGMSGGGPSQLTYEKHEDSGERWYYCKKEIEDNSPSRRDGIDLKRETRLRRSYCSFVKDMGMRLKLPQIIIATAIVFCHRFFLCQSHAKNDWRDVYYQQREQVLLGERLVLETLGFDLIVRHPYKPLIDVIRKLNVGSQAFVQVAWNFVNDGFRTTICLQFKPHQIAAAAIYLSSRFLKVKLPSDGEKVW